jgi:iron complex outermembrane receptor protein
MHDEVKVLHDMYLFVAHRHVLAQNRVDRNEMTTPSYDLLDAGLGFKVKGERLKVAHVEISLSVQNILNTPYLNHLSRYRLINVPEQGRNFVVTVKVPFRAVIVKKRKG